MIKLLSLVWFALTDAIARRTIVAVLYGTIANRYAEVNFRKRYLARVDIINGKILRERRKAAGVSESTGLPRSENEKRLGIN